MFYVFVWFTRSSDYFLRRTSILSLLRSHQRLEDGTRINIVFLEGLEKLSPDVIRALEQSGAVIRDGSAATTLIRRQFPGLTAHYKPWGLNCFIRWLMLREMMHLDGLQQAWLLDTDLLLITSLRAFAATYSDRTFILQGCPSVGTISDQRWFDAYEAGLLELDKDPVGYSALVNRQAAATSPRDVEMNNLTLPHAGLLHEQALQQHLIRTGELPQDSFVTVSSDKFYLINLLDGLHRYHAWQSSAHELTFSWPRDGTLSHSGKRVPFIHFHNDMFNHFRFYHLLRTGGLLSGPAAIRAAKALAPSSWRATSAGPMALAKGFNALELVLSCVGSHYLARDWYENQLLSSPRMQQLFAHFLTEFLEEELAASGERPMLAERPAGSPRSA